jgi:hypothetical protein
VKNYSISYFDGRAAYSQAAAINDGLEGASTYFVEQEHWVNTMLLQSLKGQQELSAMQHEQLRNLALTCPYLAGRAVYKARGLEGDYFATSIINERQLCNSQGVYRQAGPPNPLDASALNMQLQQLSHSGATAPCFIYPNPVKVYYISQLW